MITADVRSFKYTEATRVRGGWNPSPSYRGSQLSSFKSHESLPRPQPWKLGKWTLGRQVSVRSGENGTTLPRPGHRDTKSRIYSLHKKIALQVGSVLLYCNFPSYSSGFAKEWRGGTQVRDPDGPRLHGTSIHSPSPQPQAAVQRAVKPPLCGTHSEDQAKGKERGLKIFRRLKLTKQKNQSINQWQRNQNLPGSGNDPQVEISI